MQLQINLSTSPGETNAVLSLWTPDGSEQSESSEDGFC